MDHALSVDHALSTFALSASGYPSWFSARVLSRCPMCRGGGGDERWEAAHHLGVAACECTNTVPQKMEPKGLDGVKQPGKSHRKLWFSSHQQSY